MTLLTTLLANAEALALLATAAAVATAASKVQPVAAAVASKLRFWVK